jgi:twitching motility protein PilT
MPEEVNEIDKLFGLMPKYSASDLHLKAGSPPIFRIATVIRRLEMPALTDTQIEAMVDEMLTPELKEELDSVGTVDFAYSISGVGRFRVNVFRQRGALSMAARRVLVQIPTRKELHLPDGLDRVPSFDAGMVLVAGPTGCGKSTTIASLINEINKTRRVHILTIENPIEYLFRDDKAFVNQREIGIDVETWHEALKFMVREDPDVILIGELRDIEGVEAGIMAAETGHLVFGTIHASSAAGTISRLLDFFPQARHNHIRQLLHFNLRAVLVQKLMRGCRPEIPMVPAVEVMIVNPFIKKLIREGNDQEVPDTIRGSRTEGMQDMNQAIADLIKQELISVEEGMDQSSNPEALEMMLKGISLG